MLICCPSITQTYNIASDIKHKDTLTLKRIRKNKLTYKSHLIICVFSYLVRRRLINAVAKAAILCPVS